MNVIPFPACVAWTAKVMRDERQRIIENAPNAKIILELDQRWAGVFRWNEVHRRVFLYREIPPGGDFGGEECKPRPLTDFDLMKAQSWFQREGGMWMVRDSVIHSAVYQHAKSNSFHPIKEYLGKLVWDGVPRLETWLIDYCGVADSPYSRAIGKMTLTGLVRRMMEPGCKMDYMLILEGAQGIGKSAVPRILAQDEYFGEAQFNDLASSDVSIFIRNKWIVEFGELHALRKAEINELKMWLAKQVEDYRPKYGRENIFEPRQCIFVGTSNNSEYLNDSSGGRRFWPVHCSTPIDTDGLKASRDQILAEAVDAWLRDEPNHPTREFELEHFAPQQEERQTGDIWSEILLPFLARHNKVTYENLFGQLRIDRKDWNNFNRGRIRDILVKAGWSFKRAKFGMIFTSPTPIELAPAEEAVEPVDE